MTVYKATDADMTCHMGDGIYQYQLGVTAVAEKSKCGSTGLHACEYVMDCLSYYHLGGGTRVFRAVAEGDIAEDGRDTRISCTKLTLVKELTNRDIAREAMLFMLNHPKRQGWQHKSGMVTVAADKAGTDSPDGIAIARGPEPQVKGAKGAHLGWIREDGNGITAVKLARVGGPIRPDTWYTLNQAEAALEAWE